MFYYNSGKLISCINWFSDDPQEFPMSKVNEAFQNKELMKDLLSEDTPQLPMF